MFIEIEVIKRNNLEIVALAKKGADLIAELKNYIGRALPADFRLDCETPHKLQYMYFGYTLIFRVTIDYNHSSADGFIRAYYLSNGPEPVETYTLVAVRFDKLGNVTLNDDSNNTHKYSPNEFSQPFISKVFGGIIGTGKSIILKP